MATNTTIFASDSLPPLPAYTLKPLPPLIPGFPDQYLSLALLAVAYWAVSLFFHLFDVYDLFPQYRLHTPAEVLKRNRASRWDVFRDVIIQQTVQTFFGLILTVIEDAPTYGKEEYDVAVWASRIRIAQTAIPVVLGAVGVDTKSLAKGLGSGHEMLAGALAGGFYPDLTQTVILSGQSTVAPAFAQWELLAAKAIYYIGIPFLQFITAICILDTWQYFMHRAFHMNKWLYTTIHSRHHRLYVPYAYGALYNHPVEGLFMDTLGAGIAYLITGMTVRQSMCFFTCSTVKTVDDHCGYTFPWDPLQHLTSNNAGYHDVHHQSWGIKTNFSQPFFTFWDTLLGTKWTGGDVSARYEKAKVAAQKKTDADKNETAKSITGSQPSESLTADPQPYDTTEASSIARVAQPVLEPPIPLGKATHQAAASRQQILDDRETGGVNVLAEEATEEVIAQKQARKSPRKRATSSGLKGFADRVSESLQGKATGVLGVESGRR